MKKLSFTPCLIIIAFVCSAQSHAQSPIWKQIDGLYGGVVRSVCAVRNGSLIAATDGGVYRSTNNGSSWTRTNLGVITYNWMSTVALHPSGTLLAGSDGGLFFSSDDDESWRRSGSGYDIRAFIFDTTGRIFVLLR